MSERTREVDMASQNHGHGPCINEYFQGPEYEHRLGPQV